MSTKKDDEETDTMKEARSDWLSHPYTEAWAKSAARTEAKKRADFFSVCDQTTDPKVAKAYAEYIAAGTFAGWLRTGEKK